MLVRKLCIFVFSLSLLRGLASAQPAPVLAPTESGSSTIPKPRAQATPDAKRRNGIDWGPLLRQWFLNLTLEHTERILKEPKTRQQLSGRFFNDWFDTVSMYHFDRWDDNDKFFTSDLGHPMQGAIVAAIFWQNDNRVRYSEQDFHSVAYRHALLQAFAFVTFDAVQWKLGPLSESSIGNVGLPAHWWEKDCKQLNTRCEPRTGLNDLLLNEIGGLPMTIGFQWLDKHVQRSIEDRVQNRALIDATRMLTDPPQAVANIVRFKRPWFRDNRR